MTPKRKEPDLSTYSGRLAARLRKLRDKAGLSVEEVAVRIERFAKGAVTIDKFRIYKWESGVANPPYDLLPFIAKALKVKSVRELMPAR